MSTDEQEPAEQVTAAPDYAEEAEAMETLAMGGFQLVHASGPESAPEQLTYLRPGHEHTDFVYLGLREDAFSTALRFPIIATAQNFEEASGEVPAAPLQQAKPGSIVDVVTEVLEWPGD